MRYSTHISILVFCALFVWIQNVHAQNSACDCLNETPTFTSQPQDMTICEGDTVQLTVDATGRTSFPTAYFFEKVANQATRLFKYNYRNGQIDTIPLNMSQMGDIRGGTYIGGDTLAVILANGNLFYVFDETDSVRAEFVRDYPERPNYEWQGLDYTEFSPYPLTALAASADTSILYDLGLNSPDTTVIESYQARLRGLDFAFGYTSLDINTDSLVELFSTANGIQTTGIDLQAGQGIGVDFFGGTATAYLSLFNGSNGYLGIFPDSSFQVCIFDTIGTEQIRPIILLPSDTFQRDSLTISWTPLDSLSNPDSFSTLAYPSTTTTYTYTVTDICGNSISDTVRITVNEEPSPLNSQSCIARVNITLDSTCSATVEPEEILTPDYVCANEFFRAIIPGRSEPVLGPGDVGDTLTVRIEPNEGGNSCWATILVEDKQEPVIACEDDTIDFSQDPPPPMVSDNCDDNARVDTLDLEFIQIMPCDPNLLFGTRETIVAVDSSGNRSDTCVREIYVRRPVVDDIIFPDSLSVPSNNPISCETNYPTLPNSPYPTPEFAGEPMTIDLVDINDLPSEYNIDAYFEDIPQSSINTCKTSVLRMWYVVTWICNDRDTVAARPQLIEIVDTTGPSFTCPSFNNPVTTSGNNCTASVSIPYPDPQDNCSDIERVTVSYPMNFISDLQPGGATIELEPGANDITYTVYDECLNSSSCTFTIQVEDNNGPTTICRSPNVGLNQNGPTRVYASSFDDGSFDDCGIDRIEVARMTAACGFGTEFGPYVEFNCCDVGAPVMIVVRAYDESGNFNDCMTEITVQDKSQAVIIAPDDITVSCEYPIDTSNLSEFGKVVITDNPNAINNRTQEPDVDSILLTDPGVEPVGESFYGFDGVAFDNCDLTIESSKTVQQMACNRMRIERTFTALANGIPQASDVQVIIVENVGGFTEENITWPKDTMIVGSCGGQSLHPDSLPAGYGYPEVERSPCSSIMFNYEDELYYSLTPGDSVCYKVLRTWRVLDWCTTDRRGDPLVFTDVQLLKVVNTQGPVFAPSQDSLSECSTAPNCGPGFISLTQSATDDCTSQSNLRWRYQIDENNDGSIEHFGNTPNASDTYPIGTHRIIWSVEDECGNETDRIQLFTIESCKLPSPVLESGLILELTPMDLDQDGVNETGMSQITAHQLGSKSFHACGYEVQLSFSPDDLNDTIRVYDCDSVGIRELRVWVTDINGRQDFARTYIAVQDNQAVCGNDPGPIYPITGNITNTAGQRLANTMVQMAGDANFDAMTDNNGEYQFPPMPGGGTYRITPVRNDELLNGVSTFDILLIQQFILGLNDFDDPLLHIAADIDKSEKITGKDIVELRKVILGINNEFPNNTSWRFVDANYQFGTNDPLTQNFPESYFIPELNSSMNINFQAVKVGDVNNTVNLNSGNAVTRAGSEYFMLPDMKLGEGQTVEIPVFAKDGFNTLYGFQMNWAYNARVAEFVDIMPGQLAIGEVNTRTVPGSVKMSWTQAEGIELDVEEPLFFIRLNSQRTASLNSVLYLTNKELISEIYTDKGIAELNLVFHSMEEEGEAFQLLQNQPNPFNGQTTIRFQVPEAVKGLLIITDVNGKQILQLERAFTEGWNEISLTDREIGEAGIYYYQVMAGPFKASKKMIKVH